MTSLCQLLASMSLSPVVPLISTSSIRVSTIRYRCSNSASHGGHPIVPVRRSGNYKPTLWDDAFIQSLPTHCSILKSSYIGRVKELKQEVKTMLGEVVDPLHQLELVDNLQRLGLSYHFNHEINSILTTIHNSLDNTKYWVEKGLYASALAFRIFRQHGCHIPQDLFVSFMNENNGEFEEWLRDDTKGVLCLYEASYLSVEGEIVLDKAKDFSTKHLQELVTKQNQNDDDREIVIHALELPLRWRMPRLESRWFIDIYEKRHDKIDILLELAKLDFDIVQASHQEDLKHASRRWRNTCIAEKLRFSRDRLVECFLWTVGYAYEPEFGYMRKMMTKVNALITTIDDVYDVYASLDELKLFTNAVHRWDLEAMEQLPDYMKILFFSLFNSTNEMAFDVMKNHGINITSYLTKSWEELCKSYLIEAEWYYSGYKPTLQEYLHNAWISISTPLSLVHVYFFVTDRVSDEAMACLEPGRYCNIIRWSSVILRLADDLGTSSEEMQRGDVPKSIQCYMHERGVSEEEAREHIKHLISETWKKMNEDATNSNSPFCRDFVRIAMNVARMAQCMYQYGDGHSSQDQVTQDRILSILIRPVTY